MEAGMGKAMQQINTLIWEKFGKTPVCITGDLLFSRLAVIFNSLGQGFVGAEGGGQEIKNVTVDVEGWGKEKGMA